MAGVARAEMQVSEERRPAANTIALSYTRGMSQVLCVHISYHSPALAGLDIGSLSKLMITISAPGSPV